MIKYGQYNYTSQLEQNYFIIGMEALEHSLLKYFITLMAITRKYIEFIHCGCKNYLDN